jgi:hypothetical protein
VLNISRSTGLAPEVVTAELLEAAKAALPVAFKEGGPVLVRLLGTLIGAAQQ